MAMLSRLFAAALALAWLGGAAWGQNGVPGGVGLGIPQGQLCIVAVDGALAGGVPGCGASGAPTSPSTSGPTFIGTAWNPLDKSASISLDATTRIATASLNADAGVRAVDSRAAADTGKYYFEVAWTGTVAGTDTGVGITLGTTNLGTVGTNAINSAIARSGTGTIFFNGATSGIGGQTVTAGQFSRVAVDKLHNTIFFSRTLAGVCQNWNNSGVADPATNVGGIDVSAVFAAGAAYPVFLTNGSTNIATLNPGGIGAPAFACPVPSGFTPGWPVNPPVSVCVGALDLSTGCVNIIAFGGLF
jgi:hypothetical protein